MNGLERVHDQGSRVPAVRYICIYIYMYIYIHMCVCVYIYIDSTFPRSLWMKGLERVHDQGSRVVRFDLGSLL